MSRDWRALIGDYEVCTWCSQPPLRVVLVDDHKMVVDGSATMPSRFADRVTVAGTADGHGSAQSVVALGRVSGRVPSLG